MEDSFGLKLISTKRFGSTLSLPRIGRDAIAKLRDSFDPGYFFVELQDHGFPENRPLNEVLGRLAKELELAEVAELAKRARADYSVIAGLPADQRTKLRMMVDAVLKKRVPHVKLILGDIEAEAEAEAKAKAKAVGVRVAPRIVSQEELAKAGEPGQPPLGRQEGGIKSRRPGAALQDIMGGEARAQQIAQARTQELQAPALSSQATPEQLAAQRAVLEEEVRRRQQAKSSGTPPAAKPPETPAVTSKAQLNWQLN